MPTKIWYYEESPCEVPAQKFEGFSNRQPPKCKRYCYPRQISLSFLSHFKWLRLASKWLKIHRSSKILKFKYFYHQLFFFSFRVAKIWHFVHCLKHNGQNFQKCPFMLYSIYNKRKRYIFLINGSYRRLVLRRRWNSNIATWK